MYYTSQIMHNLMRDLLDFAQFERNTFKLNKEYFSLFKVIEEALAIVTHKAQSKNVEVITPVVEASYQSYYKNIYGDKLRFLQVIINLLSNSLKFSEANSRIIMRIKTLKVQTLAYSEYMRQQTQQVD